MPSRTTPISSKSCFGPRVESFNNGALGDGFNAKYRSFRHEYYSRGGARRTARWTKVARKLTKQRSHVALVGSFVAAGQVTAVSYASSVAQAHAAFLRRVVVLIVVVGGGRRKRQCFARRTTRWTNRWEGGEGVWQSNVCTWPRRGEQGHPRARARAKSMRKRCVVGFRVSFPDSSIDPPVAQSSAYCASLHRLLLAEETPHDLVPWSMCN